MHGWFCATHLMGYFTGSVHCVQKALALLPCPWEAIAIANLQNALAGGVAKTLARSLALSSLEKKNKSDFAMSQGTQSCLSQLTMVFQL